MQAAIGQNDVAVTPMNMALVAESVATGGRIFKPRFVDCVQDQNGRTVTRVGREDYSETGDNERPHAWFIAFAPAEAPKYAVAVLVEHGGTNGANAEATGGRVAAPIAKQVLETLFSNPLPASRCG
jgi:peptidoglycan glycosyltransferase